jgi:hypothetical protein
LAKAVQTCVLMDGLGQVVAALVQTCGQVTWKGAQPTGKGKTGRAPPALGDGPASSTQTAPSSSMTRGVITAAGDGVN